MRYLVEVHLENQGSAAIHGPNPHLFLEEDVSFEAVWEGLKTEDMLGRRLYAVQRVIVHPLAESYEYTMEPKLTLRTPEGTVHKAIIHD